MRLLLISSSNVHGYGFLDHAEPEIRRALEGCRRVGFVPFAAGDHEDYIAKVRERFAAMRFDVSGIATKDDLDGLEAIFIGGGNTFRLLKTLYERGLVDPIRAKVRGGLPYVGSSAGSVIAAPTMRTTNDMPIVEPPSFDSFGFVPFQINCHYLDADPDSTHKGETREQRINEFHEENDTPVIGIREGSALRVEGDVVTLAGDHPARIFRRGQKAVEVEAGSIITI